jgi:hypothetical protein
VKPATAAMLGTAFVILGIVLALIAWTIERQESRFRDGALQTTGRVVAIVGKGPVVRFLTAGGDHVDVTVPEPKFSASHAIGQDVPVYYHPDNPTFAGLDDRLSRWGATAAAGALSLVSLLIGVYLGRISQRT